MTNAIPKFEDRFKLLGQQKFNDEQTAQLRLAYKEKLTVEQLKIIGNRKFSSQKMHQIILGCVNGLSMEEIVLLSLVSGDCVFELRRGIQRDISIEQASFIKDYIIRADNPTSTHVYCLVDFFKNKNLTIDNVTEIINGLDHYRAWNKNAVALGFVKGE